MSAPECLRAAAAGLLVVAAPLFAQDTTAHDSTAKSGPRRHRTEVFDSATLRRLPVDDVREIPVLVPGVYGLTDPRRFSVRGGSPEGAAVYVDGALIRNGQRQNPELVPPIRGITALSFSTGLVPAAMGHAKAGLLDITTPAGGHAWSADVHNRGDGHPDLGAALWRAVGFNRLDATAGGPLVGGVTLFAALQVDVQQSLETEKLRDVQAPVYIASGTDTIIRQPRNAGDPNSDTIDLAIPRFVQYSGYCDNQSNGDLCRGLQVPFTARGSHVLQAKLQRTYGTGGRISLTFLRGRQQTRDFAFTALYNPSNRTASRTDNRALILDWRHLLPRLAGRPLRLNVNVSYQRDERVSGPLTLASEAASRELGSWPLPSSLEFVTDASSRHTVTIAGTTHPGVGYLDDTQVRCLLAGQAACQDLVPFLDRNDLLSAQPYRMNPYAAEESFRFPLYTGGLDGDSDLSLERRLLASVGLGWQVTAFNEISAGVDFGRFDTRRYASGMVSAFNIDAYAEKPVQHGAYVQSQLSLRALELQASVRVDRFDSRALYPIVPGRISSITDTIAVSGRDTFRLQPFDPLNPTANFRRADANTVVSPQLRLIFEAGRGRAVRFTAGRQVQAPDFRSLFTRKNTDLSQASRTVPFGRSVGLGHLDLFELGARFDFGLPVTSADVAIYSEDLAGEGIQLARLPDPGSNGFPGDFRVFTQTSGRVRGVDIRLERRFSSRFAGALSVSHQGGPALNRARTFGTAMAALTFGERAPLGGVLAHTGFYSNVRISSNRHYTLQRDFGEGLTIGDVGFNPLEEEYASSLPLFKTVDIRITRAFSWARSQWLVFIESKNLLNWTNLTDIFTETGAATNPRHRERWVTEQVAQLESEAAANGLARTLPGGEPAVDLQAPGVCAGWTSRSSNFAGGPADCVLLHRAERRFGNGDGLYTRSEYSTAFGAWYDVVNAPYRFYGPGRRIRLGLQVGF